jgi:hypothetical protein
MKNLPSLVFENDGSKSCESRLLNEAIV